MAEQRSYEESGALEVTFEQRGSGRQWAAEFRLGSETENARMALQVAWDHNAAIVGSRVLQ